MSLFGIAWRWIHQITFFKNLASHEAFNSSYAFAPDGSAFYVTSTDREQCVCGYDLKEDYTTQVYIVHDTANYGLLSEFDSHTDVHLFGTTKDGKLIFSFHHDPGERDTAKTHDAFENDPCDPYMQFRKENGFGFIDPAGYEIDTPELAVLYESGVYYDQVFIRGNTVILANNDEIVRLDPEKNDEYRDTVYTIPGGMTGYNDNIYLSYDGDFIVYPIYQNSFQDTELHVLKYEGDSYSEIFEQEYNDNILLDPDYFAFMDVPNGITYGNTYRSQLNGKTVETPHFSVSILDE